MSIKGCWEMCPNKNHGNIIITQDANYIIIRYKYNSWQTISSSSWVLTCPVIQQFWIGMLFLDRTGGIIMGRIKWIDPFLATSTTDRYNMFPTLSHLSLNAYRICNPVHFSPMTNPTVFAWVRKTYKPMCRWVRPFGQIEKGLSSIIIKAKAINIITR